MTNENAKQDTTARKEPLEEPSRDMTVCDIIGEWGAYQTSLTLFGVLYSAILSTSVVVGPMWTPEMRHVCAPGGGNATAPDFASNPHQCSQTLNADSSQMLVECQRFVYDDQQYGQMLTNTFDLVCSRQWLRQTLSSAALTGMLISSVTLGLLSDRYGRLCCIQVGFVISMLATIGAILSHNYFLLNVCFMFMSLAQVGVGNALSTLVMEATSPKYRFVSVFEYGIGWGLGLLLVPIVNSLTRNYRHFLLSSLVLQLMMLVWCHFGVFESIRWLLSEGRINRAQIELRRACRINRVRNGTELAQKIASVQASQVRKASKLIDAKMGGMQDGLLTQAIRRSFLLCSPDQSAANEDGQSAFKMSISESVNNEAASEPSGAEPAARDRSKSVLSPTLAKKSFSVANPPEQLEMVDLKAKDVGDDSDNEKPRDSITNRAAILLVLQYSKVLQEQDEGTCFLAQMFHRKLYKTTVVLAFISIMLETSYFGLVQASGFVGYDIDFNYAIGALSEWLAAVVFVGTLWLFSRRVALVVPILLSSLACLGMAVTYYLIPNSPPNMAPFNQTILIETGDGQIILGEPSSVTNQSAPLSLLNGTGSGSSESIIIPQEYQLLIDLREQINVALMTFGKLVITVAIQIAATITMESYPNNLRQSGSGAILIIGRACSVVAPFLFGDHSNEKFVLQITLAVMGAFGFLVCLVIPLFLRETKDQELCDRLDDIGDRQSQDNS